ncbi:MAG: hypothetical protein K6E11_02820 [Bacilli bacterium]|nr:hypothetical protein [Bacilli bacterium]
MKKIKTLLVALTTASLLASCGGKGAWKEYNYKRVLSVDERDVLVEKVVVATFSKLNKVEWNYNFERTTALKHSTTEQKQVYEVYKNDEYTYEMSNKYYSKQAEKESKQEYVNKRYFACFDEENRKYASVLENGLTGVYTYNEYIYDEGDTSIIFMNEICEVVEALQVMDAYEDKKGNIFFANNTENETYETEDYGHYKKVKHTAVKQEEIALLNEDLSVKSLSQFELIKTNKDPDTKEFSKKLKENQRSYWEYKFSYGERSDGSSKLAGVRAEAKDGYRLAVNESQLTIDPTVKGVALKADGTELTEAAFAKVDRKRLSFGKYHYAYKISQVPAKIAEEEVATLKVKLTGNSISNAKDDPVAIDAEVPVGTLVAGNSGLSLADGKLSMGKAPVNIMLEFDLEATAEGASFTNVVAHAELYVPAE